MTRKRRNDPQRKRAGITAHYVSSLSTLEVIYKCNNHPWHMVQILMICNDHDHGKSGIYWDLTLIFRLFSHCRQCNGCTGHIDDWRPLLQRHISSFYLHEKLLNTSQVSSSIHVQVQQCIWLLSKCIQYDDRITQVFQSVSGGIKC